MIELIRITIFQNQLALWHFNILPAVTAFIIVCNNMIVPSLFIIHLFCWCVCFYSNKHKFLSSYILFFISKRINLWCNACHCSTHTVSFFTPWATFLNFLDVWKMSFSPHSICQFNWSDDHHFLLTIFIVSPCKLISFQFLLSIEYQLSLTVW